jgi:hypothetical protein
MRYLAPATDVHERMDRVQIAGVLGLREDDLPESENRATLEDTVTK